VDRRAQAVNEAFAVGPEPAEPLSAIPLWTQVVGFLLLLAFLALSVEAYFGPGLRSRLLGFAPAPQASSKAIPPRAFYETGSSVRVGQRGIGSEGQDRVIQEGDVVLLGATGQLVRLGSAGRADEIPGSDGAGTTIVDLGAWDPAADRLVGVPARFQGGRWVLDAIPLQSVGADLHPAGAPSEALTDGFWLGPDPDVGRVRRVGDRDRPALRIRASKKTTAMMLETRDPLPTLDGTLVSVTAVVRGQPGKTMVLTLEDVPDARGNAEAVSERRTATDEWTRLTVRRRVVFPSQNDRISLGLVDADAGDWIEVRDLDVRLGVVP
jgi:hypothetical protein